MLTSLAGAAAVARCRPYAVIELFYGTANKDRITHATGLPSRPLPAGNLIMQNHRKFKFDIQLRSYSHDSRYNFSQQTEIKVTRAASQR